ncbi:MAG: hypothetical protein AABZ25_10875 [Nitrospirota bacterium]
MNIYNNNRRRKKKKEFSDSVKIDTMKKVGFIYDDIFLKHETPEWHPESKERLIAIINALKRMIPDSPRRIRSPRRVARGDLSADKRE